MEINRHNCEEWFLLYSDDELDVTGRRRVEEFVADHADMAALLEGFLNARFKPDENILFDGKQSLLKKGEDALIETDWERLLLMADGEITGEEHASFEMELTGNPLLRSQWESIAKARLKPDLSIIHPDRPSLYRKDPAFPVIRWFAVSAAASLLLLLGWRLWPSAGVGPVVLSPIEATAKNTTPDSPKKVEMLQSYVQAATGNPPVIHSATKSTANVTNPPVSKYRSAPAENEWSQTVAGSMDSKRDDETIAQPENETVAASESLAVNDPKAPAEVENSLPDEKNATAGASHARMHNVKTDFATEALVEEASEPAVHAIRRTILSRSGLKTVARKADRYYQKITNPTIEPRPMVVSWTSNRN